MNFALSDEQILLREAARGSLSRFKTIEAARDALEDPTALPDLWPAASEAGWPGLLVGGPNASPSDPISQALGKRPPMRMYVDDHLAYSCNEPTINCNAPLVFALAATLSQH